MAQNRVTFKQLLQAEATDVAQIDAVRLGSVNECLVSIHASSLTFQRSLAHKYSQAVMLMASKFNIPCVPHNGAMGKCARH